MRLELSRLLSLAIFTFWIWLGRRTFHQLPSGPWAAWLLLASAGLVIAGIAVWKLARW